MPRGGVHVSLPVYMIVTLMDQSRRVNMSFSHYVERPLKVSLAIDDLMQLRGFVEGGCW